MKITIKTLQGKPSEYQVGEADTLEDLKKKIASELSVDVESQKLILFGKVMTDNNKKLVDYGVKDKDFLVLMVTKKAPERKEPAPMPKPVETAPPAPPKITSSVPVPVASPEKAQPSAPVPPSAGAPSAEAKKPVSAEERLVVGEEYEKSVQSLMEMGFPRDQVVLALKAAFNNPDRATDYLLNGIPAAAAEPHPSMRPRAGAPSMPRPGSVPVFRPAVPAVPPAARPAAGGLFPPAASGVPAGEGEGEMPEGGEGGMGDMDQLRARILQDPSYLNVVIQQLQATNPQLAALVAQNPQALLQLLFSGRGGPRRPPHGGIQVTPEEKAAIDRLKALGFTEMQAAQAYFACDKNEMLAANFLFENADSLREEAEGGPAMPPAAGPGPRLPPPRAAAPAAPVAPSPAAPAEVKKEEKKAEPQPEKKEEGSSLQLDPKPEDKKTQ